LIKEVTIGVWTKRLIVLVAAIQIGLILGFANLGYMVEHWIPAQYWSYLPDWVVATTGERGDFLVNVAGSEANEIDASDILASLPTSTPTPTATATATSSPTPTAEVVEETATQSALPVNTATSTLTPTPIPPTSTPIPSPTPTAIPPLLQLQGLQAEAQKFNNCGPTNLAIVLNFYGDPTTQLEAGAYLKPNHYDRNVSPWQISDYVNEFTELKSITRANGDQELLKRLVAAGYPVVIEKGYDPDRANARGWYGHYLTIFGYDDAKEEYNTIDTFLGPFTESDVRNPNITGVGYTTADGYTLADGRIYTYEYIEYYWQQFNYTYYVVYPPEKEGELFGLIGPEANDNIAMWWGALMRAQEDIEEDEENAFAWFNLGTAFTQLGRLTEDQAQFESGALAFDKALSIGLPSRMLWYQHQVFFAYMQIGRFDDMITLADNTLIDAGGRTIEEVYLYKGHAQSYLGEYRSAANSYEKALELNENFYPAQFGLDYVNSLFN
ncbi:MAG: C39 family peptidase, partial [Chloroflexota bacterium]